MQGRDRQVLLEGVDPRQQGNRPHKGSGEAAEEVQESTRCPPQISRDATHRHEGGRLRLGADQAACCIACLEEVQELHPDRTVLLT